MGSKQSSLGHRPINTLCYCLVVFVLIIASSFIFASPAMATPTDVESAKEELDACQTTLDEASDAYFAAVKEQEEAAETAKAAQNRLDEATAQIEECQNRLDTRVRSIYRYGVSSLWEILLGSESFSDFVRNWDLVSLLNSQDVELTEKTKMLRSEIEMEKQIVDEQKEIADDKAAEAERIKNEAQEALDEAQSIYDRLSAEQRSQLSSSYSVSYSDISYDAQTGNAIVDRALAWVGKASYSWGGCSPGAFDCSGFVSYCLTGQYSRIGTTYTFMGWGQVSDPQPGDVCVNSGHCGIYYGNGMMIHCSTYGVGVIISPVQSGMIFVRY